MEKGNRGDRTTRTALKESSSIILVTSVDPEIPSPTFLQYLITKRSENHPHLANTICFPGGTSTEADSSIQWQVLFKSYGEDLFNKKFISPAAHLPNIYRESAHHSNLTAHQSDKIQGQTKLPKQVALRITGIRETFEECGILLCKPVTAAARKEDKAEIIGDNNPVDTVPVIIKDENEIRHWQDKVRRNPEDFLTLCQHLSCLPDLDSLVDWSTWLSPRGLVGEGNRFETIFYIKFCPQPIPTIIDPREVAYAQWTSASEILDSHHSLRDFLPPPQYYEMTRLKDVQRLEPLKDLAGLRARIGLETWCPLYYSTDEGFVAALPGDILYRENHQNEDGFTIEMLPIPVKAKDEKKSHPNPQHRFEMDGLRVIKITATAPYRFGQRYPALNPTGTLVKTFALKSLL